MMKIATGALVGLAAFVAIAVWFWPDASEARAEPRIMPVNVDIVEGEQLYAVSCAACHGANLEGQDDWRSRDENGLLRAPPHDVTGHTWHHGDQLLFDYTKLGGNALMAAQGMEFESGMPGFGDELTDQQIWNILAFIKSTWPQRIQDAQAARTALELEAGES